MRYLINLKIKPTLHDFKILNKFDNNDQRRTRMKCESYLSFQTDFLRKIIIIMEFFYCTYLPFVFATQLN